MKTINLRELYPFYRTDVWIEVNDEIVQEMHRFELLDSAYKLRAYRHAGNAKTSLQNRNRSDAKRGR